MPFFSWEFAPWPISQQEALGCQGGETELSAQALPAEHYQPLRQTSSGRLPRRSLRPLSFDYVGEDLVAQGPSDLIRTHKKTPTEDSEAGVDHPDTSEISHLLRNNREWAKARETEDPTFFSDLANQQNPTYFWIGCSDSRVPANQILGLAPGELFSHRNVGNLASTKDLNFLSGLEYAVRTLKVRHIIVCGHTNCGAVNAALRLPVTTQSLVNTWVSDIRDVRNANEKLLLKLSGTEQVDRLCELNITRQVFNVCTSPVVQSAWKNSQAVAVHGLLYNTSNGIVKELLSPIGGPHDLSILSAHRHKKYQKKIGITRKRLDNHLDEHFKVHMAFSDSCLEGPHCHH